MSKADETVTVRMPAGAAHKLRAYTGQPFSRLTRTIMLRLLERYENEEQSNLNPDMESNHE